ncbi:hypothetical protein [Aneurinibacillus sp. REN35]|uniref:hypothetical protein n=1 Tax=Aneurinibacillus sp. REN35 TaxID=3237286 RepID=UPI003528B708
MKRNVWFKWTVGISSVATFIGLVGATKAMDEGKQALPVIDSGSQKNTVQGTETVQDTRVIDEFLDEWKEYKEYDHDDDEDDDEHEREEHKNEKKRHSREKLPAADQVERRGNEARTVTSHAS